MMLLRCTRKVLKLLGQLPRQVELSQAENGLAEWYVDIVDAFGPTFFLCTNPGTIYTLVRPVGPNDQVADLSGRLLVRLVQHMTDLGTDRPDSPAPPDGDCHKPVFFHGLLGFLLPRAAP